MNVTTCSIKGIVGAPCDCTASVSNGLPSFEVYGLADAATREARVRVRSALINAGATWPAGRVVANVGHGASLHGTCFDLPIAVAVLAASGALTSSRIDSALIVGELALDGSVRPVRGAVLAAEAARDAGKAVVLVPADNAHEAARVDGVVVRSVGHLKDVLAFLEGHDDSAPAAGRSSSAAGVEPDFADVRGLAVPRRMMEVAAAGAHNVLLVGGPGTGKTMLARRLPSILPALTEAEALEVTRLQSVAGLSIGTAGAQRRPFRAPHHSTTSAGLFGGGVPCARPGELSLAHHGVLFLDELPEFPIPALEMLREPLATGTVDLHRASGVVSFPANTLVVAAMNPCTCGMLGATRLRCRCTAKDFARYRARIARYTYAYDLNVGVSHVDLGELADQPTPESSEVIRQRVAVARARQLDRQGKLNAKLDARESNAIPFAEGARSLLLRSVTKRDLTLSDVQRLSRVALTIADLEGSDVVTPAHVAETLMGAANTI